MNTDNHNHSHFQGLGIAPNLLAAIEAMHFTVPTPVQAQAIPVGVTGRDIIGIAQTGTGKTLAFGIPMVQRLAENGRCGLVLVPTRELALQVNDALSRITAVARMRTVVLIGGESIHAQAQRLRENPRIIVATPGRLNDHLKERRVRLDTMGVLVLDEADRMLDMGFFPQIERVLKALPRDRQTMLFSATMPASVIQIAAQYMRNPERIEVAPQGTATELVTQEMFVVNKDHKGRLLGEILKDNDGSVLLFVRTRRNAGRVTKQLRAQGHAAAEIHADRSLGQRKDALRGFKTGEYRVLVATDIAARGIDVTGIELVVNYDLPDDPENYVHRIGRTGRAGREGRAITFATPDQGQEVQQIEKMLRASIPCGEHPDVPRERFIKGAVSAARSRKPAPRGQQGGPKGMSPVRRSQGAPAAGYRHASRRSGVFGLVHGR